MKAFAILLLGVIIVTLITSSIAFSSSDDSVDDKVVSEDKEKLNLDPSKGPKYKIFAHVLVRNAQGALLSVVDTEKCQFGSNCSEYMPHELTDFVFDTGLGKKEIITFDNIKYEKVQFSDSYETTVATTTYNNRYLFDVNDREPSSVWVVTVCGEPIKKYGVECANIFQTKTLVVYLELGDFATVYWTILREMN